MGLVGKDGKIKEKNEGVESQPKLKNIEQSIERMLKRSSGEKDETVKRDGNIFIEETIVRLLI